MCIVRVIHSIQAACPSTALCAMGHSQVGQNIRSRLCQDQGLTHRSELACQLALARHMSPRTSVPTQYTGAYWSFDEKERG